MGKFRSLWRMSGFICEYSGLFEDGFHAYCLSVVVCVKGLKRYRYRVVSITLLFNHEA
jgi:hypothetical protein